MPAPMTRARRLRIERAVGCETCGALSCLRCTNATGGCVDPHPARVKAFEALHPPGGSKAGRTVPVPLGDMMPQYRALSDADKARVREAMALRGKAEIADIAHGRG